MTLPIDRMRCCRITAEVILVFVACFILGSTLIGDFGATTDEPSLNYIGNKWIDKRAKNESKCQVPGFTQEELMYGPGYRLLSRYVGGSLAKLFRANSQPFIEEHFAILFLSSLSLSLFYLLLRLLEGGPLAVLGVAVLSTFPQFVGHAFNNPKDVPQLLMAVGSIIPLIALSSRLSVAIVSLVSSISAIVISFGFVIRPSAVTVLAVPLVAYLLIRDKCIVLKATIFAGFSFLIVFLVGVAIIWPFASCNMFREGIRILLSFNHHPWDFHVLYFGEFIRGTEIPWHFHSVSLFLTSTPLVAFLSGMGVYASLSDKQRSRDSRLLPVIWLVVPLAIHMASSAPRYDGIRHILYILPAMAWLTVRGLVFSVESLSKLWWFSSEAKSITLAFLSLITVGYQVYLLVMTYPYPQAYFNYLAGTEIHRKFESDYWGASLREAVAWLNSNVPPGSRVAIGQHLEIALAQLDRKRIRVVDVDEDPDFIVLPYRGSLIDFLPKDKFPEVRGQVVLRIERLGTVLLEIRKLKEPTRVDVPLKVASFFSRGRLEAGILQVESITAQDGVPPWNSGERVSLNMLCQQEEAPAFKAVLSGVAFFQEVGLYSVKTLADDDMEVLIEDILFTKSEGFTRQLEIENPGYVRLKITAINTIGRFCFQIILDKENISHHKPILGSLAR